MVWRENRAPIFSLFIRDRSKMEHSNPSFLEIWVILPMHRITALAKLAAAVPSQRAAGSRFKPWRLQPHLRKRGKGIFRGHELNHPKNLVLSVTPFRGILHKTLNRAIVLDQIRRNARCGGLARHVARLRSGAGTIGRVCLASSEAARIHAPIGIRKRWNVDRVSHASWRK